MTLKGVKIGDRFIDNKDRKSKRSSTVVDFIERKSILTGKVFDYEVWAEKDFIGQKIKFQTSFTTVIRNKIQ